MSDREPQDRFMDWVRLTHQTYSRDTAGGIRLQECHVRALFQRAESRLEECDSLIALLQECADALRDDIEGCASCNYGHGSTGLTSEGEPCEGCSHLRDLLKRIEEAL